ncbi:hypothetical protein ACFQ1I_39130 [Kitasatospora arboriphila]
MSTVAVLLVVLLCAAAAAAAPFVLQRVRTRGCGRGSDPSTNVRCAATAATSAVPTANSPTGSRSAAACG